MKYYGGKWRIASWIIEHFPAHRIYVEPYAGAASVLLRKEPVSIEVLNDINQRIISVFRVLRDPEKSLRLQELLSFTPYSMVEHDVARKRADCPVEDARRMIVLGHQSHGSTGPSGGKKTGWRRRPEVCRTANAATAWANIQEYLPWWCERLRRVYIECDDALAVIKRWDSPDALIYVDPPYVNSTRSRDYKHRAYAVDMTDADHVRLAETIRNAKGMVIISGYDCPLYRELYRDWQRIDHPAFADRGKKTTESIWLNARTRNNLQ